MTTTSSSRFGRYWIYLPLLLCVLIMLPRLASPQFGLLDDGRSLTVAQGIVHGRWDLSWDVTAGRFRPVYWAAFASWYLLVGGHAFWYFLGNLLVFSASTFLLIQLIKALGGSNLQSFLTGLVFALSTPVIENVYTLSKGENLQVLLLLGAMGLTFLAVKSAKGFSYWLLMASATLLILLACLTKENTLIILPISLLWWAIAFLGRWRHITSAAMVERITRRLVSASFVGCGIFYLARSLVLSSRIIGVGQSSEFSFAPDQLVNSAVRWGGWMLRDYLWLLPLALIVLVLCLVSKRWPHSALWWLALIWMVLWWGLYLPWHFALEYYLLPFAAGAAVFTGVLLNELVVYFLNRAGFMRVLGVATIILTVLLLVITQANSFSDAAIQLAQDIANQQALDYVASHAPIDSNVVVNIRLANEYIEQMQLMLNNFYHRPDLIVVNYQGEDLTTLRTQQPATTFLLATVVNQPKLTVRMGLDEPSLKEWNASVLPVLASWHEDFQVSAIPFILTLDFPSLLCPVVYRENYCTASTGLFNFRQFRYQWSVYTP